MGEKNHYIILDSFLYLFFISSILACVLKSVQIGIEPPLWLKILTVVIMGTSGLSVCVLFLIIHICYSKKIYYLKKKTPLFKARQQGEHELI